MHILDIERMAKEAYELADKEMCPGERYEQKDELRDFFFAKLVAAAEREACAKVCEAEAHNRHIDRINLPWDEKELRDVFRIQAQQATDCAKAIRAREQNDAA